MVMAFIVALLYVPLEERLGLPLQLILVKGTRACLVPCAYLTDSYTVVFLYKLVQKAHRRLIHRSASGEVTLI